MISYFSDFFTVLSPGLRHSIPWTIFTFIILPSIWRYLPSIDKWYNQQDREKQIDWNARTSAAIHAALIFSISFYVILFDENFTYTDIRSKSALGKWMIELSTGYFLSDCIVLYKLRKYYANDTPAYLVHHIVSIFGLTQTLKGGAALWFTILRLCTELSTPFMNINFMLTLFNLEGTKWFNLNRHISFWTFLLCRPCLMPIFWSCTFTHIISGEFWEIEIPTICVWLIGGGGLDVLNLIWTKTLLIGYYHWMNEEKQTQCKKQSHQNSQDRKAG